MKFIVVQISKKRWVIAELIGSTYVVITGRIKTAWEAAFVRGEIADCDTEEYSHNTKRVLGTCEELR